MLAVFDWKKQITDSAGSANARVDMAAPGAAASVFHLLLIKPTKYDDDGYPIQWFRSFVPSNSLACLHGIALDAAERRVLGADVEIRVAAFDEACDVVDYPALIGDLKRRGQKALVCLVGVQTNQFPRAVDVASLFTAQGIAASMGGFHVSGCLSVLGEPTPELKDAQARGISLFAGEAEAGRFDAVVQDAYHDRLRPLYDYSQELVDLQNQPRPSLPKTLVEKNLTHITTIDVGRGCPYQCSFCCIINVQGRVSRSRSPDDLEAMVRQAHSQGMTDIFITDDDFARNKDWQAHFDRLIQLRREGLEFALVIQVDALCHKIPGFIDKAVAAGVVHVFIGLENINPDNLKAVQKRQNKITEYRRMLLAWKRHPVVIWGAYIIGFPDDTRESVLRDIEILKRELPIDLLNPSILTPLPGSMDHKRMLEQGVWMDPDLNRYDLAHRVIHHRTMSDAELDQLYIDVWQRYYTFEHMCRVLKRAFALGSNKKLTLVERFIVFGVVTRVNRIFSYDMGLIRRKQRQSRRPGLPIENALVFHARELAASAWKALRITYSYHRLLRAMKRFWTDPDKLAYRDTAITPPTDDDLETLDLFTETRGAAGEVQKAQFRIAARNAASRQAGAGH